VFQNAERLQPGSTMEPGLGQVVCHEKNSHWSVADAV